MVERRFPPSVGEVEDLSGSVVVQIIPERVSKRLLGLRLPAALVSVPQWANTGSCGRWGRALGVTILRR